jgi:hypothetical protein
MNGSFEFSGANLIYEFHTGFDPVSFGVQDSNGWFDVLDGLTIGCVDQRKGEGISRGRPEGNILRFTPFYFDDAIIRNVIGEAQAYFDSPWL